MKQGVLIAGALALAIGAGVLLYVRSTPPAGGGKATREALAADRYEAGQAAFAPLASVAVAEIESPDGVMEILSRATIQADVPAGVGTREDLLRHVSEFVYHRFVAGDVAGYLAWRERAGYQMLSWAELDEYWGLGADYVTNFGAMPAGLDSRSAFERFWALDAESGALSLGSPVGLVSEPAGIVVCAGEFSGLTPVRARISSERMGEVGGDGASASGLSAEVWDGRTGAGYSRWFGSRGRAGTMAQTSLSRTDGAVVYGDVALILVFGDGTRVPFRVGCCWDAERQEWSLETLAVMNARVDRVGPKVF